MSMRKDFARSNTLVNVPPLVTPRTPTPPSLNTSVDSTLDNNNSATTDDKSSSAVKVYVRVRPFNERELSG